MTFVIFAFGTGNPIPIPSTTPTPTPTPNQSVETVTTEDDIKVNQFQPIDAPIPPPNLDTSDGGTYIDFNLMYSPFSDDTMDVGQDKCKNQ